MRDHSKPHRAADAAERLIGARLPRSDYRDCQSIPANFWRDRPRLRPDLGKKTSYISGIGTAREVTPPVKHYGDVSLFIDGRWQKASSGKTIDVIDPATEEKIGTVAQAGVEDLDRALAAAEKGFAAWRKVSALERSKILRRAAENLRTRVEDIAGLMTREQGKPLAKSRAEVFAAADTFDWFAEEARRAYGRIVPARAENVLNLVIKQPVGPVAAFTPWNFPIIQIARKLAAALAAGCSIIIKAPEETPASPAALIQAVVDAGVPDGAVNLVYGVPAEISAYLIPHPVIRKISFTGSTAVGKQLAALAGAAYETRHHGTRRPRAGDHLRRCRSRRRRETARQCQVPQRRTDLHFADALSRAGEGL